MLFRTRRFEAGRKQEPGDLASFGNMKMTIGNDESPAVRARKGVQSLRIAQARNGAHGYGVIRVLVLSLCAAPAGCGTAPATPERVAPGEYDLTIACGIYIADRYFPSDSVIRADLKGNHVYLLRAEPQARKCYPYLEDTTGKE